jgi:hypothetical protein
LLSFYIEEHGLVLPFIGQPKHELSMPPMFSMHCFLSGVGEGSTRKVQGLIMHEIGRFIPVLSIGFLNDRDKDGVGILSVFALPFHLRSNVLENLGFEYTDEEKRFRGWNQHPRRL